MAFTGMNIEEVRQTAAELKNISDQIEGLMRQLDGRVQGTTWTGPDADMFKNDWWPRHRTSLQNIANELEGLSQSANNNANEQEQVSSR